MGPAVLNTGRDEYNRYHVLALQGSTHMVCPKDLAHQLKQGAQMSSLRTYINPITPQVLEFSPNFLDF